MADDSRTGEGRGRVESIVATECVFFIPQLLLRIRPHLQICVLQPIYVNGHGHAKSSAHMLIHSGTLNVTTNTHIRPHTFTRTYLLLLPCCVLSWRFSSSPQDRGRLHIEQPYWLRGKIGEREEEKRGEEMRGRRRGGK